MIAKKRESCRICGSRELSPVINLGDQFLASAIVTETNKDKILRMPVPLDVVRCNSEKEKDACGLVQLLHTYPADLIYREYWYRSGINQTIKGALQDVVTSAQRFVKLSEGDVVVDIGCNDGTLLSNYNEELTRIGIDPVENIRGERETFIRVTNFFDAPSVMAASVGKKAKVVTSIAMFYDLEDPNQFVADIAEVLHPDGVWIVQMADLPEMLSRNMFDQIIHEHLEYYHFRPFRYLVERHGLKVVDVEKNRVNGSSYRFYVRKAVGSDPDLAGKQRIDDLIRSEAALKLETEFPFEQFRNNVQNVKRELVSFVRDQNRLGKKIFGYGASTKGNVILQFCGLTHNEIHYVADRNPMKFGGWTIGSGIPIISEEQARKMNPDYFLVLPYYFLDEMLGREKTYLEEGGKFIIPTPALRIIDSSIFR